MEEPVPFTPTIAETENSDTYNCNDSKTAMTDGDGVKTDLETENSEVSSNL